MDVALMEIILTGPFLAHDIRFYAVKSDKENKTGVEPPAREPLPLLMVNR